MVDAGYEGSFKYDFLPGELSGGRPFGLVINVNYMDTVSFIKKQRIHILVGVTYTMKRCKRLKTASLRCESNEGIEGCYRKIFLCYDFPATFAGSLSNKILTLFIYLVLGNPSSLYPLVGKKYCKVSPL